MHDFLFIKVHNAARARAMNRDGLDFPEINPGKDGVRVIPHHDGRAAMIRSIAPPRKLSKVVLLPQQNLVARQNDVETPRDDPRLQQGLPLGLVPLQEDNPRIWKPLFKLPHPVVESALWCEH